MVLSCHNLMRLESQSQIKLLNCRSKCITASSLSLIENNSQTMATQWAVFKSWPETDQQTVLSNWTANHYHNTNTWWEISFPWLIGILPPCGKTNIVLKCKECGWAAGTLISNYEWMKNQSVSVLPILWKKPEWTLKVLRQLCFALAWHQCCLKQTVHLHNVQKPSDVLASTFKQT